MRATAVVLSVDLEHGRGIWGHVGDSRLYYFRRCRIVEQTRDHSVVQSMVDAGYIAPVDLRKNANRGTLLAALGDREGVTPEIEPAFHSVGAGDTFLLCTDGLWEHVEERDMERLLEASENPEDWLRRLEAAVLAQACEKQDNYSALVVACG